MDTALLMAALKDTGRAGLATFQSPALPLPVAVSRLPTGLFAGPNAIDAYPVPIVVTSAEGAPAGEIRHSLVWPPRMVSASRSPRGAKATPASVWSSGVVVGLGSSAINRGRAGSAMDHTGVRPRSEAAASSIPSGLTAIEPAAGRSLRAAGSGSGAITAGRRGLARLHRHRLPGGGHGPASMAARPGRRGTKAIAWKPT